MQPPRVFLSYRRQDTAKEARILYEQLTNLLDPERTGLPVFLDHEDLESGRDFRGDLRFAVTACKVMLVLISQRWLPLLHERLQLVGQEDYVRFEIRLALEHDRIVVPVLLGGVDPLPVEQLPDDIRELAFRQAITCQDHSELFCGQLAERVKALLHAHAVSSEAIWQYLQLPPEVETEWLQKISDRLDRAVHHREDRPRLLAEALHYACIYVDSRNVDLLIEGLRDSPSEWQRLTESFLGTPEKFRQYLLRLKEITQCLDRNTESFRRALLRFEPDLFRFLACADWVDQFLRSWEELRKMVCSRAAHFELLAPLAAAAEDVACCLAGVSWVGRGVLASADNELANVPVPPQLVAGVVVAGVRQLGELLGVEESVPVPSATHPRIEPVDHGPRPGTYAESVLHLIQRAAGPSASALHSRVVLADDLAHELILACRPEMASSVELRQALRDLLAQTSNRPTYEPLVLSSHSAANIEAEVALMLQIVPDTELAVRKLRMFAAQIRANYERERLESSDLPPPTSGTAGEDDIW